MAGCYRPRDVNSCAKTSAVYDAGLSPSGRCTGRSGRYFRSVAQACSVCIFNVRGDASDREVGSAESRASTGGHPGPGMERARSSGHGGRGRLCMGGQNLRQPVQGRLRHYRDQMERPPVLRPAGSHKRRGGVGGSLANGSVRCAIFPRVSTDAGLDQEFNSLDAQYDASQAYIRSQAHAGWILMRSRYDDGGFSGGATDRPALQQLLADVKARRINVIVVYKVDRLTRSLADFAKLVELFDAHGVSFVSVTQQFNTTTSMGRLTLNVLLSFAQFEREVTSERIRDKIAASKRKGLWVGGVVPLGYQAKDRKITVVEEEAETVRHIFQRYLELGSLNLLMTDLRNTGIKTKVRPLANGLTIGGIPFTRGPLAALLRNRFYVGEVKYRGEIFAGEQPAILDRKLFEAIQSKLDQQRINHNKARHQSGALLIGRIFDERGNRMTPTYAVKKGVRYCYYISTPLVQGQPQKAAQINRVPAAHIEKLIISAVRNHLKLRAEKVGPKEPDPIVDEDL